MSVLIPAIGRSLGPAIRSIFSLSDAAPTYYWDFRPGRLDANMSFTRASSGWYFNSAGVLTSASSNVARFDYDPATLSPLGYLAEMQSTNSLLNSADFTQLSWSNSNVTISTAATTAPDGTTTGNRLTESAASGKHDVFQTWTLSANSVVGVSVFFKAGTRSSAFINFQDGHAGGLFATVVFDLSNGVVGETKTGGTGTTLVSYGIRNVGGGWYRAWLIASINAANPYAIYGLATAPTGNTFNIAGEVTYAGDGASLAYIWGAQADTAGVGVTSYIPTAGSTVTRSQDILSMPLTSLPGWNASKGGVLAATYRLHTINPATPGNTQYAASIDDGSVSNSVLVAANWNSGGAIVKGHSRSGGVTQFTIGTGASGTVFARRKLALGWGTSRAVIAYDGTLDTGANGPFTLPVTPTELTIGSFSSSQLNGTIESIAYYAGARPDAFVQAVSR